MPITRATSLSGLVVGFLAAALSVGCGSSNGPANADPPDGAPMPVTWCAAYKVINCSCQQCHQNPPLHGAPIPLMIYADTQAPFPTPMSSGTVWQEMQTVVGNRFMPFTGDPTVMPPVQPLSDDQRNTLLTWLSEGATDAGGQNCVNSCDWSKSAGP
jgi:hypothetical protein